MGKSWLIMSFFLLAGCTSIDETIDEELAAVQSAVIASSTMDCRISAAYSSGYCYASGTGLRTASFRLNPATPACGAVWYGHPECNSLICSVPISAGQTITLGAYYIACATGSPTLGAGATAEYERDACPRC
jgi:hypothetical protein